MSGIKPKIKPKQIMLSKRANVFYLEHVRVMQKDDRVVYLTGEGKQVDQFFNIPERNTVFILLGKGSSITDAAARKLADSNVLVGFCGNGGSPLFSSVDCVFLSPQSEYRPTEYMQAWVRMWINEPSRLETAKVFFEKRLDWVARSWSSNKTLSRLQIEISEDDLRIFIQKSRNAADVEQLLSIEGDWAKRLYGKLSRGFSFGEFRRDEGKGGHSTQSEIANSFLDHGNYIAYGYASASLNVLGISFAFPVMHGKTRRGALVFDVADLFKDAIVLPLAFQSAADNLRNQEFRDNLIEDCVNRSVMDEVIETIKNICHKNIHEGQ